MLSAWVIVRPTDERNVAPTVKSSKNGPSTAAIVPRWDGVLRGVGRSVLRETEECRSDRADARVHLAVAVRAQHHALFQLCDDPLPFPRDAVLTDAKELVLCVDVMEVEQARWPGLLAAVATTAHVLDRTYLQSTAVVHDRAALAVHILRAVMEPMTVRAEHVALLGLNH